MLDVSPILLDYIGSSITAVGYLKNYKLKEGDVVIDAGAYYGLFTLYAANKVGPTGKVIALEPSLKNFNILNKRAKKAKYNNIVTINKGLYNKKTSLTLEKESFLSSSKQVSENASGETILTDTLDNIIKELDLKEINFIKMDVEGVELEILESAEKSLKITRNLAIACYHLRDGKTTGKILEPQLKRLGFKTEIGFPPHQTLYATKA
jgi:FkbM family methyltransferase